MEWRYGNPFKRTAEARAIIYEISSNLNRKLHRNHSQAVYVNRSCEHYDWTCETYDSLSMSVDLDIWIEGIFVTQMS